MPFDRRLTAPLDPKRIASSAERISLRRYERFRSVVGPAFFIFDDQREEQI